MTTRYSLKVKRRFSSAHYLRDYEGPCARMHGHDYKIEVEATSTRLQANGLAIDCADLKKALQPLIDIVDHRCINEIEPFTTVNPTAENIAAWFYQRLQAAFVDDADVFISAVTIHETEDFSVCYRELVAGEAA